MSGDTPGAAGERADAFPAGDRRVLVWTGHFYPHVGGVERYNRELWRRVVERGWQVVVITGNTNQAPAREWLDGLLVIRLPVLQLVNGRLPVLLPGKQLRAALAEAEAWKPHVVATNTRFFSTSLVGVYFGRRRGIPTLHIDHGAQHIPTGSRLGNLCSKAIDHTIGIWVLKNATRCVGCSAAVATFLEHLGRADAGVLPNGIGISAFEVKPGDWRQRLGLSADSFVVLYVGRLIDGKGIPTILDAFEQLRKTGAHLVIAGSGHLLDEVRKRAAENPNLHVLGEISGKEVGELLAESDLFVHASTCAEGMPTTILEAAAAGLPIVATLMGGTREILPTIEFGHPVRPNDSDGLASAIDGLRRNPERRRRMGERVRHRVRDSFEWGRVTDAAIEELLALRPELRQDPGPPPAGAPSP